MKYITKGSIWRKWDLQIHTPDAKHADQYTQDSKDSDIWSTFLNYLKKSDVDVFGIADYFSIASYEKILEKTQNNPDFKDKVFFPNIELRLSISTNKAGEEIHIHLIFDNNCPLDKIKNFLSKLKTTRTKLDGSPFYCTPEDLDEAGYDTVSVDLKEIKSSLEAIFGNRKPYLIAGSYRGQGGLIYGHKQGESKRKKILSDEVDKFCDFFFSKEKDKEWFLKSDRYENKDIKSPAKPVVSTSDCHSFKDCKEHLGKESFSTWIKSDRTFEGLKQILFEPKDRTGFGYSTPESKKTYHTIDKVRFIDNRELNFMTESIEINQNLTTIIGGKSTGKSLLLYYIAKTIDQNEVKQRFSMLSSNKKYDFDEMPDFNFEVIWSDGHKNCFKETVNQESKKRKIVYIPQNYLNKLSEMDIKSKKTLNKFVKDILFQDENIKKDYIRKNNEIMKLFQEIPSSITNLLHTKNEIETIKENIKQIGEDEGIKKYVEDIKRQADEIKKKSGLTQQEMNNYESLLKQGNNLKTEISILEADKENMSQLNSELTKNIENIKTLYKEQISSLKDVEINDKFKKGFCLIVQNTENKIKDFFKNISLFIDNKISDKIKNIKKARNDISPLLSRVRLKDELNKKYKEIQKEQDKLNKILVLKNHLEIKKNSYDLKKQKIIDTYKTIYNIYNSMRNELKKYEDHLQDISLSILIGFDNQKFNNEVINECLNKGDIKRVFDNRWQDEYQYQYESNKHINFIETVFNSIVEGKIKTIKNKEIKEVTTKLLENYFDLDFKISYNNDFLDKMSPGKKGLILLRLLIDLSNEEWPILLDQPEDDLDNRSVYHDLVSFIRNKKKERQIIIVTHNPNLTVGADSEEVIVANQEGQERGRENKKYKFEYISGALENSFEYSKQTAILLKKGIRQHACEILEGGTEAFLKREKKYNLNR